ncbi:MULTISPECIES: hypothetical protein [Methylomicrobium]|uniref:hypothetical protein n=1 Tax=Methylomicrobium TaxID=39773 RepID=UPI0014705C77|nr:MULTISPECIES: hypothetical protein [Methylomicrobium]
MLFGKKYYRPALVKLKGPVSSEPVKILNAQIPSSPLHRRLQIFTDYPGYFRARPVAIAMMRHVNFGAVKQGHEQRRVVDFLHQNQRLAIGYDPFPFLANHFPIGAGLRAFSCRV